MSSVLWVCRASSSLWDCMEHCLCNAVRCREVRRLCDCKERYACIATRSGVYTKVAVRSGCKAFMSLSTSTEVQSMHYREVPYCQASADTMCM